MITQAQVEAAYTAWLIVNRLASEASTLRAANADEFWQREEAALLNYEDIHDRFLSQGATPDETPAQNHR